MPADRTGVCGEEARVKQGAPCWPSLCGGVVEEVNWTHQLLKVDQVVVERLISLVDEGDVCQAVITGQYKQ